MLGATIALAAIVLGQAPSNDPSALVRQLASPRYARREAAGAELSRLGRAALPALRAALSDRDAEVRARASTILAGLEKSTLVEPTPIALDFRDVPIADALAEINRRAGLSLVLAGDRGGDLAGRKLTLRSAEPLPFWTAIDRLCEAGGLHYEPAGRPSHGRAEGSLVLDDEPRPSPGPVSDSGPFRVHLGSLHYLSEIDFTQPRAGAVAGNDRAASPHDPARPRPVASRQFYIGLQVAAEPRLSITTNGQVRLSSATDDRGRSLLIPASPGGFQHSAGYFGMNPSPSVRLRVDLERPEGQDRTIKILRGTVPLIVAARKPGPLEVSLASAAGKTFRNHEVSLTVGEFRPAEGQRPPTLDVTIRPLGAPAEPLDPGAGEPLAYRADSPQSQVEILDARGQAISWFPSGTFYAGEETRLTMTLISRGAPAVPATIRYHGIIRAPAEVPFEFRDVPIP